MRIARIIETTLAEGPGCRFCIWVQGCPHKCSGCFAAELWNFEQGEEKTSDEIISRIKSVEQKICGITLLGGEPFAYSEELSVVARYVRSLGKSVIAFSGYEYEYLKNIKSPLLCETDLLIDGKFIESKTDYSRPLVGSSNQKFVFLTDRISKEEIKKCKNRFEVRTDKNGKTVINGMGNIGKLKKYLNNFDFDEQEKVE